MKKNYALFNLCCVLLFLGCTTDNLEQKNVDSVENKEFISTSKYINLKELKEDNPSFLKFQKLQEDLNTLRNSESFGTQFLFLINTSKILLVEDRNFKTFTFPLYRSENNPIVENLVLKIGSDGGYEAFHIKYNLTNSDKNKVKNNKDLALDKEIEIIQLNELVNKINSKAESVTGKAILNYQSKCYELVKKKETVGSDEIIYFDFLEVTCIENVGAPTYTVINPNSLPPIIPNATYQATPETAYNYMQNPYTLGYNFSSYPVLDDPIEENNIRARLFFDRLTTNMRKWALVNSGLYDKILIKLTAENWDLNYEYFALNVLAEITAFHIEHWADITPAYEEEIFNRLLAGGKITWPN